MPYNKRLSQQQVLYCCVVTYTVKVLPTEPPTDYPAQDNPYNTLPPSKRWGYLGRRNRIVRTLTYPLRFITWGTREMCFQGVHAQAFLKPVKETFKSEDRTRDLDDVKYDGVMGRSQSVRLQVKG